jgi:hypothetical protein
MKIRFSILWILFLSGTACYYTHRSSEGPQISSAKMQEIRIGQTTEADLLQWFGPPTKKERQADGIEGWQYTHTRVLNATLVGGMVIEPIQREMDETFEIALRNGIVQSYRFLKHADGGKE